MTPVERALEILRPFDPQIVRQPARLGTFVPIPARLHPRLNSALRERGIEGLYRHQAIATETALDGADVLITSSTNSGKSLCAHLPVLQTALTEPSCRSLYLYPTKALAQDQLRSLDALAAPLGFHVATFDGDTPKARRATIRNEAHVVLTNPDMLHAGILGGFEHWERLLKRLRWIVLDEAHAYRGVFGAHVAHVLRRLLRLAQWYGSQPRVIALSATLANAHDHLTALIGRSPVVIDFDDAPQPERVHAYLPAPAASSVNKFAGELLADFAAAGVKTLAFSAARASAELVLHHARHRLTVDPDALEGYRGGYTAADRRKIEKRLREGHLRGVSATNALELGIDLGDLDAVIVNGYPGRVASYRQQVGRAGRGARPSLSVLIGHRNPVDAHFLQDPHRLLANSEIVPIRTANPQILRSHLLCACAERPMDLQEQQRFWPDADRVIADAQQEGTLVAQGGRLYFPSHTSPTRAVSLRTTGGAPIRLLVHGEEIGTEDRSMGRFRVIPGAVLLVRGETYAVQSVEGDLAHLLPAKTDVYSLPLIESAAIPELEIATDGRFRIQTVRVTETAKMSGRRSLSTDELIAVDDLAALSQTYTTIAVRLDLPDGGAPEAKVASLHALEHALLGLAGVVAGADRQDLGSCWYTELPEAPHGTLFIYDRAEGGTGVAESLFAKRETWLRVAEERLENCACGSACPQCLLMPACPFGNEVLDRAGALSLIKALQERA